MAIEKLWKEIPPVTVKRDSPFLGGVAIDEKAPFREKMQVILTANTLPNLNAEIERFADGVVYLVKPKTNQYLDVSAYTVSLNAKLYAPEQTRDVITEKDQSRDRYERGPVNADRNILVDQSGEYYTEENPLPAKFSGTIEVANDPVNTPIIVNMPIVLANTEYQITLSSNTKRFEIGIRDNRTRAQFSFTSGQSGTNFITIDYGNSYREEGLTLSASLDIFIQLNKPNQVLEILTWE